MNPVFDMFLPITFCDGVGEPTSKVVAIPLHPALDGNDMDLVRPRVMQDGTGAVMEFMSRKLSRSSYGGYSSVKDLNVATNIPGLDATAANSMTCSRVRMLPEKPLDTALARPCPFSCCRVTIDPAGGESVSQVYMPRKGWTRSYHSYEIYNFVMSRMLDILCAKFGCDRQQQYEHNDLTAADRAKYKDLFERIDKLVTVDWNCRRVAQRTSMAGYLGIVSDYIPLGKIEPGKPCRHITPEDMVEAGLLDSVEQCYVSTLDGYGFSRMDKPYKLRLIPLEAMPYGKLAGGYLPPKAQKLEKDVTAETVLKRSADAGVQWKDETTGQSWVQVAFAKMTVA